MPHTPPPAYQDRDEYAISTWTLDTLPLDIALQTIAAHGFHSVELWADTVHLDPRAGVSRTDIRAWLKKNGQQVHSVHAPFRNFANPPTEEAAFRALRMKLWRKTLEDCALLEAPIMVVHALDRYEYNYRADQLPILHEVLGTLNVWAGQLGVTLALENIGPGRDANEFSCTLANQHALLGDIGLSYCLDIGHVPLNGSDAHAEVDAAGDRLVTLHIHNNDGRADLHALPDDGILNWPSLRAYIREKGYRGQFVMEVLGGSDPRDTVRRIAALFAS